MAIKTDTSANLGFEAKLWAAADAFEEQHVRIETERDQGADPDDPDEYRAVNIFWVPREARWSHLKANAKQPTIGRLFDEAMVAIEQDNVSLKGVLPKDYARPGLDKQRLGQLIDLISNIGLGDKENRSIGSGRFANRPDNATLTLTKAGHSSSHIEEEVTHVAILDDVVLALDAHGSTLFGLAHATGLDQLRVGDHLRADEAALDVRVNRTPRLDS